MLETAQQVHSTSSRLRLRLPARRRDDTWFRRAAMVLVAQPGVAGVQTDAARASLTLHFGTDAAGLAVRRDAVLAAAGIRAEAQPQGPGVDYTVPVAGARLRADRRTIALGILLLLLARNLIRSGWLAPGLALLWFLWESLPALRGRVLSGSRVPSGR